jgi:hypothetical protein
VIGMVHRNKLLQFTDNNSNVNAQTSTYKVVCYAYDSCLEELVISDTSTSHTTMLLQVSFNSQSQYSLNWTPYIGLSSSDLLGYYIYKGTSPSSLAPYDTTQSILNTAYVDIKDSTEGTYYYFVEAAKKSGCDETATLKRSPNTPIRSNSINTKGLKGGINSSKRDSLSLSLFPNPFHTSTTLQYTLTNKAHVQVIIYDMTGKQVGFVADENELPCDYMFDINAEKYHLNPGVYLLKMMLDDELVSRRLIKF